MKAQAGGLEAGISNDMNMNNVLCPTDFSESSAHAIDWAVMIAAWYKARIVAIHVAGAPAGAVPEFGISSGESIGNAETERLRSETARCFSAAERAGVALDILVDIGPPAARILDRALALPADLIVMGTHGVSGFERLVLGSVTEKVLRKAVCPVLTVPPLAHATSRIPFNRLLCAVDFSDSSLAALQSAVSLAQEADARLTVLHVIEWPWEEPPPPKLEELPFEQASALAEYRRYCEKAAAKRLETLVPDNIRSYPPSTLVRHGQPYVQILEVAADQGSDVIVIGVRGRNALDMMMFGSTANQIVRRATCPVLTLRR
jgi:nucleotide-binding universal stress UspA family protein